MKPSRPTTKPPKIKHCDACGVKFQSKSEAHVFSMKSPGGPEVFYAVHGVCFVKVADGDVELSKRLEESAAKRGAKLEA